MAQYCPRALVQAPTLMATADSGLTFTFGTDANGNAIEPFGQMQLYRQQTDFPDFPLECGVDYAWEGSRIRMMNYVAQASAFPSGAPYYYGMIPTTAVDGTPTITPADKRVLTVNYACSAYARAGGAFDPSPYEEAGLDGQPWPRGLSSWIMQLQLDVANSGVLAATRSSPALGARLRRIANTRLWPFGS